MKPSAVNRFSVLAVLLIVLAASASAQQLKSTEVAAGLDMPIGVTAPPGDVHRIFILEREGRIRIVKDGVLLAAPFLDITSDVYSSTEGGLLGLAFHPDYAFNGRFFVSYTDSSNAAPLVREYRVGANPDRADATSATTVFGPYSWPTFIHYASDLHFGPDGKLYYSLGDANVGTSQLLGVYWGKLLRIDVDIPPPHVPVDNPFTPPNDGAQDLIWAYGLRNPYRFSFDRLTGDLYIADVGNVTREEIDFQPASFGAPSSPTYQGGRNYGWQCMEGSVCTGINDCICDTSGATLVLPVYETPHGTGAAIIGGYAYRGSAIPGMQGRYFCTDIVQNGVTSFIVSQGHATNLQDESAELDADGPGAVSNISSFGQDSNGEIYMTCLWSGKVFRIDPAAPPCPAPVSYCTTSPNSAGSGATIGSTGSASITASELSLLVSHCPHHVAGFFFYGTQQVQIPLGNGTRCVGGNLIRLPVVVTDEHGFGSKPFNASVASISAGETRNFQFYYRDSAGGGALFNLSDGLSILFSP